MDKITDTSVSVMQHNSDTVCGMKSKLIMK